MTDLHGKPVAVVQSDRDNVFEIKLKKNNTKKTLQIIFCKALFYPNARQRLFFLHFLAAEMLDFDFKNLCGFAGAGNFNVCHLFVRIVFHCKFL